MNKNIALLLVTAFFFNSCTTKKEMSYLNVSPFGEVNGKPVELISIGFDGQLEAKVTNYGGIITSLSVPDRDGKVEDIVLGYDSLSGYLNKSPYFGALIGRYGNRIARGKFTLDGKEYVLETNNGVNHLHGGVKGFDKVVWDIVESKRTDDSIMLKLNYVSNDGEEGYPGTLVSQVTYTFYPDKLKIDYEATTDAPTVINLTQHTYFNLSGNVREDILGHELLLSAGRFVLVDSTLIPTGELREVTGTPFDFTSSKPIGRDIGHDNQQLVYGRGYDHCWVLEGGITDKPRQVGKLYHAGTGREVLIATTEPGIQFYSGNFLDGSITGKGGKVYNFRNGLCLETEHFPDSPNQPQFPTVRLNPGQQYHTTTIYTFLTK